MASYIVRRINAIVFDLDAPVVCDCELCSPPPEQPLRRFMELDTLQHMQQEYVNPCRCGGCAACNDDYEAYIVEQARLLTMGLADTTSTISMSPELWVAFSESEDLPF